MFKAERLYERAAERLAPPAAANLDGSRGDYRTRLYRTAERLERAIVAKAVVDGATVVPPAPIPPELWTRMKPRAFAELLVPELAAIAGRAPYERRLLRAMTLEGLVELVEQMARELPGTEAA